MKSVSLHYKLAVFAVLIGCSIWFALDYLSQPFSVSGSLDHQLHDLLHERARQHRTSLERSLAAYHLVAGLLAERSGILQYVERVGWDEGQPASVAFLKHPPEWLPEIGRTEGLISPRYLLLADREGKVREVFQGRPEALPAELTDLSIETIRLSMGKSWLMALDRSPYVVASAEIKDHQENVRGILILVTPVDETLLVDTVGPPDDWNLVALVSGDEDQVITSNAITRIQINEPMIDIQKKYLLSGLAGLEAAGGDVRYRVASLVADERFTLLTGEVRRQERLLNGAHGLLYFGAFIALALFLARRVLKLERRVEAKTRELLGEDELPLPCGDQLVVLESRVNHLIESVRERNSLVEDASRELESFTYSVSHDLRAPLRSIDGFSLALQEDYNDLLDETGKDFLLRIRKGAQRMGGLIDALLMLSRISRQDVQFEPINLSEIAQVVVDGLKQADPSRAVQVRIAPNLTAVGDARMARIALENLLGNAWKFTSNRDAPRIEFYQAARENNPNEAKPVFVVRDNGVGFDMEFAEQLFGPFRRLHRSSEFPGTGVGLATVQRIIQRHGGRIWAEGSINQGATFYFQF